MPRQKPPVRSENFIYGVHPVMETVIAGKRKVEEIYLARDLTPQWSKILEPLSIPLIKMDNARISAITGADHHQGIAAKAQPFPYWSIEDLLSSAVEEPHILVLLDEIQDPANLGNILRISECLGASGVVLTKDRAVPVTGAVEKSAAGASAHIPVARVVNLARTIEQLKEANFWIFAAEAGAPNLYYETDLTGKAALVLGSEGSGIRRLVREKCDFGITIPMQGKIDSLNVSQAAAVILSEALKQRKTKRPENNA